MANSLSTTSSPHPMIIESATDLGIDALQNPGKYAGFMGISVGHKFFSKATMEYFFLWGSQIFKEFIILILDDPDTYNFMIFEDLTKEIALNKARIIGDEKARSYKKVINKLGVKNIKIVQVRDFSQNTHYLNLYTKIKAYTEINSSFKQELFNLMENGIGGKIQEHIKSRNITQKEAADIKEILSEYILEEFVSLVYFTEYGYPIEIDPTREFSTKKLLYEGQFPDLSRALQLTKRGHVYTHPEGVTKASY